jgi:hypothetical protein
MFPNPPTLGRVRPPAVVNAEIRALVQAAWGRPFTDVERALYWELVAEWTAAVRRPVAASLAA